MQNLAAAENNACLQRVIKVGRMEAFVITSWLSD